MTPLLDRQRERFLADPNEPRLEAGLKLGASGTLVANREKADLEGVRELSEGGAFDLAIESGGLAVDLCDEGPGSAPHHPVPQPPGHRGSPFAAWIRTAR